MQYTDQQREAFLQLAQDIGVGPARKELGYPKTKQWAYVWMKQAGIKPAEIDHLAKKASEMKAFYTDNEKRLALQEMLEVIHYQLTSYELDPDQISKLALAAHRTIESMQLLEGKETSRIVVEDTVDAGLRELIQSEQAKNVEREAEIESQFGS